MKEEFTGIENEGSSHYYIPSDYPLASEESHKLGLALNEQALRTLKDNLNKGGKIILNLGGRPGKENLLNIFTNSGFTPEILHEEFIEQHKETSLETLVAQEKQLPDGKTFEFFNSEKQQISAEMADKLRKSGSQIFHKIYVICGTKLD